MHSSYLGLLFLRQLANFYTIQILGAWVEILNSKCKKKNKTHKKQSVSLFIANVLLSLIVQSIQMKWFISRLT